MVVNKNKLNWDTIQTKYNEILYNIYRLNDKSHSFYYLTFINNIIN